MVVSRRNAARLVATGSLLLGGGAVGTTDSTERCTVVVTLLGEVRLAVEVPRDTKPDEIEVPGIVTPIVKVEELGCGPTAPPVKPAPPGAVAPPAPMPAPGAPAARGADNRPAAERKRSKKRRGDSAEGRKQRRSSRRARTKRARDSVGAPKPSDPAYSLALPGPARIGMPNFFIDKFRIPPFLLPIYQAAGIQYGVRWEVLAAINEIETDYGRNLSVSSAGAVGWMQFMPATWKRYGTDANRDRRRDPYNPVDAIFAAARYLKAAGAQTDLAKAIFAYNHAGWYVDSVLLRAGLIGGLPADLVGAISGLTQGLFPLRAKARYTSGSSRRAIRIFARAGAAAVAAQDGTIARLGRSRRLGRFVQLRDAYGNTYTYGRLKKLAPTTAAVSSLAEGRSKLRLFAHPWRRRAFAAGGRDQLATALAIYTPYELRLFANPTRGRLVRRPLRRGARVVAGTILGRIGRLSAEQAPHLHFEVRPAGRGGPRIDPKPILDGWKLLEASAFHRALGSNPFVGRDARVASTGQILLMGKAALVRRVLANPRIEIYGCGRRDVRAGIVDRRVLATLEFLAAGGLRPTVTSLRCGHSYLTASGNVSEHSSGNAVDISAVNGIPIAGHQGPGSITDITIRRLLTLQGAMTPHQIISLMTYPGAANTMALADHHDHIHVGFRPQLSPRDLGPGLDRVLKPAQWIKLVDRLGRIANPRVGRH